MTHFGVLVRIPSKVGSNGNDIVAELERMMIRLERHDGDIEITDEGDIKPALAPLIRKVKGNTMWTSPGRMGWFASHSATPETFDAYASSLVDWLKAGDQTDYLVAVDCHI